MTTLQQRGRGAKQDVDRAAQSKSMERLARLGLIGKGLIYAIIGIIAVDVARGGSGSTQDKSGALQTVATKPFGEVLVVTLAVMFALYALWRFAEAAVGSGDDDGAKAWAKRAGYLARGAVYAVLAVVAVQTVIGADKEGGSGGGGGNEDALTARVLDWPAGRWLVVLAGLAILGGAGWNVYRGLSRKFKKTWRTEQMSDTEERAATGVGVVGHLARGAVFGLMGVFVIKAAWEYDAKETVGLDGALAELARADYGPWLLGLTAAGLICYGLFCFAEARWRDVSPDGGSDSAGSSGSTRAAT